MITHLPPSRPPGFSKGHFGQHQVGPSSYRFIHDIPHWPPETATSRSETPEEAAQRLQRERNARLINESIDNEIAAEKAKKKKSKSDVKILLLGQAESGKSTTLKNFQLHFTPKAFRSDIEAWRVVIYMNLVRSINFILEVLEAEPSSNEKSNLSYALLQSTGRSDRLDVRPSPSQRRPRTADGAVGRYPNGPASPPPVGYALPHHPPSSYSHEIRRLRLSLLPLKSIESTLNQLLGTVPASSVRHNLDVDAESSQTAQNSSLFQCSLSSKENLSVVSEKGDGTLQNEKSLSSTSLRSRKSLKIKLSRRHSYTPAPTEDDTCSEKSAHARTHSRESNSGNYSPASMGSFPDMLNPSEGSPHKTVYSPLAHISHGNWHMELGVRVRGNSAWKKVIRIVGADALFHGKSEEKAGRDDQSVISLGSVIGPERTIKNRRDMQVTRQVIEACGGDMYSLWVNQEVREVLRRCNIDAANQPGFFLDDIRRITASDYVPTTDDVLRARLSTVGVVEHHLRMESGHEAGHEWVFYDVGGTRSQRAAWAPFFDSVTAIIFLAPLSTFNEKLAEDPSVNRLQDTYLLWRTICSNKMLASMPFILFMNKYDVLVSKLESGIRFSDYVKKYKADDEHANDPERVAKYMLSVFHVAHKQLSPKHRMLHAYLTSVIDSKATSKVLFHIREHVLLGHLQESRLV